MGLASYEIIGNDGVCAVTEKPKKRLRDEGGGL